MIIPSEQAASDLEEHFRSPQPERHCRRLLLQTPALELLRPLTQISNCHTRSSGMRRLSRALASNKVSRLPTLAPLDGISSRPLTFFRPIHHLQRPFWLETPPPQTTTPYNCNLSDKQRTVCNS